MPPENFRRSEVNSEVQGNYTQCIIQYILSNFTPKEIFRSKSEILRGEIPPKRAWKSHDFHARWGLGMEATYSHSGAWADDDILQRITIVWRRYSRLWRVGLVLRKGAVGISLGLPIWPSDHEKKGGWDWGRRMGKIERRENGCLQFAIMGRG